MLRLVCGVAQTNLLTRSRNESQRLCDLKLRLRGRRRSKEGKKENFIMLFRLMTKLHSFVHVLFCSSSSARSSLLHRRRLVPFALAIRHHGAAIDVPQEALLCHQVQPGAGGEDPWCVRLFSGCLQPFKAALWQCVILYAGGRLTYQYQKKPTSAPKCGATGVKLQGVSAELQADQRSYSRLSDYRAGQR